MVRGVYMETLFKIHIQMHFYTHTHTQAHTLVHSGILSHSLSYIHTQSRVYNTFPSRLPQVSPAQPTGGRRRRGAEIDPDERRQRFLERNRAAASRCRQKRKVWVGSLERKAEDLATMNVSLTVSLPPYNRNWT